MPSSALVMEHVSATGVLFGIIWGRKKTLKICENAGVSCKSRGAAVAQEVETVVH